VKLTAEAGSSAGIRWDVSCVDCFHIHGLRELSFNELFCSLTTFTIGEVCVSIDSTICSPRNQSLAGAP
jgi:hypothetical protein